MGPKKGKEVDETVLQNAWRTNIEDALLNEDHWTVKVILIEAAGSDQDRMYLNKFEIFAAEEKRFVIKNICKTETIFMINQLGGEKKVKDDNLRVFEEAQSYLKVKKDIPPDILALVIKHLIIKMKDEYLFIKRQRLEVRLGMRRESATMIDKAEVRGTVNVPPPEPTEPPPPPTSKGKGKKEETVPTTTESETEGKKFNTQLRVRGEEWRDKIYVDDYPDDGPNLYVAITGFVDPYLPGCLLKIGIPLTAVVQIRIDPTVTQIPSSLLRTTKRGQSLTELLTETSLKFWDDLQFLRIHGDSANDFKNTAFILFSPPYWTTEKLTGSPDKIYDEVCFLMYDIQDLSRQHIHYLDNISVIPIPEEEGNEHYSRHYQQLLNDIPLECITIYSVLDAIVQTACKCQELDEKCSRSSLSTAVTMNTHAKNEIHKLERTENLVQNIFTHLCNTEANKKYYRLTYGDEYESHKNPVVINYGDFAKYNTFHLGNINLDNVVFTSLLGMPINKLWHNKSRPTGELEAKINFHVNVLLSCFDREDVETAELNRLIHILASRKLYNNRSSLKKSHLPTSTISDFKKTYLKRSILAEPLGKCPSFAGSGQIFSSSFPSITKSENESDIGYLVRPDPESEVHRIKFLFECPDISELVTAAEIENFQPTNHMIDDFDYFEDFPILSGFQIMREAFNRFNCVDYKYCEATDCFIFMFYNSYDQDGIAREEWRCHITTPVCLQDFFDFILEEHYDWIQNEEKMYEEHLIIKIQSFSKDIFDPYALPSCLENTDVQMDLLMENSLKYQETVKDVDPDYEGGADTSAVSTKKSLPHTKSVDVDSKSSGGRKSKSASSPKNARMSFHTEGETHSSIEIPAKPFLGYNLGDRRVEVFGKDAMYFSKDGTKVTSMYTLAIPSNLEYIVLNVLPGNGYNEFWMHKALGEILKPEIIDSCNSFRITTKDQVMMYVKQQTYQIPLISASASENLDKSSVVHPQMHETKYFHSLYLTWPNGMITETIYEINSPVISHVKQYYTQQIPHLNEDMRCISLNGEVVIFRPSGDLEILKPDGTFIKITKYCKKLVVVPEVEHEEASDKNKKNKSKTKLQKVTSKSSKGTIIDEDKISEEKIPEYELIINEFEIIETSGLRQKWVDDVPFDIEKLLIRTATDYCQGEVFSRRIDGTNILLNKNGLQVVTFPNKTRIITSFVIEDEEIYPEWTEVELDYFELFQDRNEGIKSTASQKSYTGGFDSPRSGSTMSKNMGEEELKQERTDGYISVHIVYTIEHANFSTITINNHTGKISIDSPNDTTVVTDNNNNYDIKLDNVTSANFNGECLSISYEACTECKSFTTCDINLKFKEESEDSSVKVEKNWLKLKDSFNKTVVVNCEGGIHLLEEVSSADEIRADEIRADEIRADEILADESQEETNASADLVEEKAPDGKSENSFLSHGKCRTMYLAKTIRFFTLTRELKCAELIHSALLEQYKRDCRWQPWCSINKYDTFGDHRRLVSLLTPIHVTESEKWQMNSKLADKPKFLTYTDLKKDSGKGFYEWMRPYKRFEPAPMKPDNVLTERLPRAFILRTLEQEWDEPEREGLKGAKELLKAVLRYRTIMEADSEVSLQIPIVDIRSEQERQIDDIIQALAHRIYEDLKVRLADDVQKRAKASITTKPPPVPEEMSVEGEFEEGTLDETDVLEEERSSLLKEADAAEEMSPNLRRYWKRRDEERKEEEFYKYLLREGTVPPYFRNVLGGAIWWDINQMAGEAVTIAQRRKMKCVCAEENTSACSLHPFM